MLNPEGKTQREMFLESINLLPTSAKTGLFSSDEIESKKELLLSPTPLLKSLKEKWLRVQSRYKIVNYQGTHINYQGTQLACALL